MELKMTQARNTKEKKQKSEPAASRFLLDVGPLRERARQEIMECAATANYDIEPAKGGRVLNIALSTECVCVLRYRQHHFVAKGIHAEPVAQAFLAHSSEKLSRADTLAKRIVQLGRTPELNPSVLAAQSHAEYVTCDSLKTTIKENLIAERIAVESDREMIAFFGDRAPTRRNLLEGILVVEEEHADEFAGLLETG
ncbi:ferritin-like domain-containing protein [Zoogloeaceae bacterium G21618-S1]|nr:ferritin-like domain-containing protein [Zoogloeaceae bacterium G21618-S1]